jgi:hypothetical protein
MIPTTQSQVNRLALLFAISALALAACSGDVSAPGLAGKDLNVAAARATSTTDMSVASTSPDSATQDTTLDVVINGSGFVSGTTATWALAGVADPAQVKTNSTRYVSSRQLVANLTISPSATVAKWDVVVTAAGKKGGIGSEMFTVKLRRNINPPTDTWQLPIADAALSLKSDGQYRDAIYSSYASGICNVSGSIFAGYGTNDSGDATIQTSLPSKGKCGRVFTLSYPDGLTETLASFANLHALETSSYAIPLGTTAFRRLTINPGAVINKTTPRCSKLQFGEFPTGGPGSDSVAVTRIDASTWQVQSQASPNDLAYCETDGRLYHMQVSFRIVSSFAIR